MAKKGSFLKTVIGVGSVAVAGKVVYDKYKNTKAKYRQEEEDFKDEAVKKYNAIAESKVIEIQDERFEGCEIKATASKVVLDLSLAQIERDVYINFKSHASSVIVVIPEGINVTCDVEKVASSVKNEVLNTEEDGMPMIYIIGTANLSAVDVIPADFYGEDDDFEDEDIDEDSIIDVASKEVKEVKDNIEDGIKDAAGDIRDAKEDVKEAVKDAAGTVAKEVKDAAGAVAKEVRDAAGAAADEADTFITIDEVR